VLVQVRPEDADGPGGIIARCSLARGKSMSPGIQAAPFYWRDVVYGPPPRRRQRGDCIHVTFHGTDDTGDVRVGFTTIIRVDPGLDRHSTRDDVVHVEERLYVQRRFLQRMIDREKAFSDRLAMRSRSRLAHALLAQRRYVNTVRVAWIATLLLWLIRVQAKAGHAAIRGMRTALRGAVALPELVLTHTENLSIHLASKTGRRTIRHALADPRNATPYEKTAVLVVLSFALVGLVLLLNSIFALTPPGWTRAYKTILADFTTSLLSTIALPLPAEPLLIRHTIDFGPVLAITGLFLGKMVGSWMLYLVGDSLNDGIQKKTAKSPRMKRIVEWMQRNADQYGFWILIPLNAIPFVPDLLVYVFAVSGMRFRSFMAGIGVGTMIKLVGIVIAVYAIGPDVVDAFLRHPIQTMRGG